MNVISFPPRSEALSILHGREPSVLHDIGATGVAATIWQRKPLPAFMDWIESLRPENLPQLRTLVAVGAVESCVQAACDSSGTPKGEFRDMLVGDIAALAFAMGEIMGQSLLNLRLSIVRNNGCHKFHIDHMVARMLCTYRGTGTQLAQGQGTPQTVGTGSVLLMRGALWPEQTTGLLHRSPPIESTGGVRLLLVIDPAEEIGT